MTNLSSLLLFEEEEVFGFELDDSRLKRAGLDYWKHIDVKIYESADSFFEINEGKKMAFFSSHAEKDYWQLDFENEIFLVFGKESLGLSKEILQKNKDSLYKIPLFSDKIRSLNLANSVGIAVYEGIRKQSIQTING